MKKALASLAVGLAIAAGVLSASLAGAGKSTAREEAAARAVAGEFFRTIDERRYARTCDLLSAQFYRDNHVPTKARCVLALTIGFTWAPSFRFRIVGVRIDGERAVVRALANRAPGQVMLVREGGIFKVLSVCGV